MAAATAVIPSGRTVLMDSFRRGEGRAMQSFKKSLVLWSASFALIVCGVMLFNYGMLEFGLAAFVFAVILIYGRIVSLLSWRERRKK